MSDINDTPVILYNLFVKAKCGSNSGYVTHLRNKERACAACTEAHRVKQSEYYRNNNKKIYEINRRWAAKNPEKVKEYSRRMFAKRKAQKLKTQTQKYTEKDILDAYGKVCHICLKEIDLTLPRNCIGTGWQYGLQFDHVTPLSKGGTDTLENVRPAHAICNMLKRNKVTS